MELVRIADQSPDPSAAPLQFASYVDQNNPLPIDVGSEQNLVWLRPPSSPEGWQTGGYQVGVFADDAAHAALADGEYVVVP